MKKYFINFIRILFGVKGIIYGPSMIRVNPFSAGTEFKSLNFPAILIFLQAEMVFIH